MIVADYIADQLFKAGVRYIFGIPGGASVSYIEAFRERGIEFILVSNEATAGFMADVSFRLTGIPGVCHATFGPGATNISTGVGGAFLDRSSVIVLTSEIEDGMLNRTVQMKIDHQELFGPITKQTYRLSPENISLIVPEAIKLSLEEYPGPVHLGLPSDIAKKMVQEIEINPVFNNQSGRTNNIESIKDILLKSRRPIIAAGLTAVRTGAGPLLNRFLETHKIPVVLTPMAKGIVNEAHPCYAGVLFHALSEYLEDLYEKTDLIIGLGYDQVEYNYESWAPDVPLVHFSTMPDDLPESDKNFLFTGSPEEWFGILENINQSGLIFEKAVIESIRNETLSVFNGFSGHFGPVSALKILKEALPDESIITADVGSHLHLLGQLWEPRGKGELIITNGWSSMGFGIPAALAASIQRPGKTVVCITGDGGFLMMAGEIITARRMGLPIIIVVLCDGELNLIKLKKSWKGLSPYGTLLYQGDLFDSDTFLGVKVLKADTEESMQKSVQKALSLKEPVIINTIIDPEDYKWLVTKR